MVVNIQVEVFWVVMPCSVVVKSSLKTEAARSSERMAYYHNTWCHNPEDLNLDLLLLLSQHSPYIPFTFH